MLKHAIEIPKKEEVTCYVHETSSVKTSFKNDHLVDLASHERDVRSLHYIIKIAKGRISPHIAEIRKFS